MDTKKYFLAALAYIVCTFLIAAPWHLVLFKPLYDELAIFTRKELKLSVSILCSRQALAENRRHVRSAHGRAAGKFSGLC